MSLSLLAVGLIINHAISSQAILGVKKETIESNCRVPEDYATIQAAAESSACRLIVVRKGKWVGATITHPVELKGTGGTIIVSGPNSQSPFRAGFLFPDYSGSGTKISNFTFEGFPQSDQTDDGKLDLPIFSRGANNVTIEHCFFKNSLQAITNWRGSGWQIQHNTIEGLWALNGGGVGIILADSSGGVIKNNLVSFNNIRGTLRVASDDNGGYNGSGIVLYADFRWGRSGTQEISNNQITHNTISLASNHPDLVGVAALELTDSRDDRNATPYPVILNNTINFNDFYETRLQIVLAPENLGEFNDLSENLGGNRGRGFRLPIFPLSID